MRTLVGILVAMATFVVVSGTSAGEPIGKVISAAQTVKATGTQRTRVLAKNDDVFYLDRISSNGSGSGEFQFSDGTKLAVGPGASLVVDEFVYKSRSRFQKLSLAAAKGTFRWISGGSSSSAYKIKTPYGTMGIRGTAFDVTVRNGRAYVALINGSATFCAGKVCRTLNRSCDFIVSDGRKLSDPVAVDSAFKSRAAAAQAFPFLANPRKLSSRFRVNGSNCLSSFAAVGGGEVPQRAASGNVSQPTPGQSPDPEPSSNGCGGNCGNGKGGGGGNGTHNEGGGND